MQTVLQAKQMADEQFEKLVKEIECDDRVQYGLLEVDWGNPMWMGCEIQDFIKHYICSLFNEFALPKEFVEPLVKIGAKSAYGKVVKPVIAGMSSLCVIKVYKENKKSPEPNDRINSTIPFISEVYCGIAIANRLRKSLPYYMYTYSFLTCSSPYFYEKQVMGFCAKQTFDITHSIIESLVGAVTLNDFLNSTESVYDKKVVLLRTVEAVTFAYFTCGLKHNDLHTENVLVRKYDMKVDIEKVDLNTGKIISNQHTRSAFVPVIIDFGMSSFMEDERRTMYVRDSPINDLDKMLDIAYRNTADMFILPFIRKLQIGEKIKLHHKKTGTYWYLADKLSAFIDTHKTSFTLDMTVLSLLVNYDPRTVTDTMKLYCEKINKDADLLDEKLTMFLRPNPKTIDEIKPLSKVICSEIFTIVKIYFKSISKMSIVYKIDQTYGLLLSKLLKERFNVLKDKINMHVRAAKKYIEIMNDRFTINYDVYVEQCAKFL